MGAGCCHKNSIHIKYKETTRKEIILSPQKPYPKPCESVEYQELVKIFAYNWIKNRGHLDINQKSFLLVWNPSYAILWMLDTIFDYLDIDDLQKMTWVSKLFWFTATLERNYEKFEQAVEAPIKITKEDEEIDKMVTEWLNGLAKQRAQTLPNSSMQDSYANPELKPKNKVKKVSIFKGTSQKNKFLLDTILEGSEYASSQGDEWNVEDTRTLENALNQTNIPNTRNNKPSQKLSSNTIGSHCIGMGSFNDTYGSRLSIVSREINCKSPIPQWGRKSPLIANGGEIVHTLNSLSKKRQTITSYLEKDRKQLVNALTNSALSISASPDCDNGNKTRLKRTKTVTSNYQDAYNTTQKNLVKIGYQEIAKGFGNGKSQFNPVFIEKIHSDRRLTVNPGKKMDKSLIKIVPRIANAFQEGEFFSIKESELESVDYNMSVDNEAKWI